VSQEGVSGGSLRRESGSAYPCCCDVPACSKTVRRSSAVRRTTSTEGLCGGGAVGSARGRSRASAHVHETTSASTPRTTETLPPSVVVFARSGRWLEGQRAIYFPPQSIFGQPSPSTGRVVEMPGRITLRSVALPLRTRGTPRRYCRASQEGGHGSAPGINAWERLPTYSLMYVLALSMRASSCMGDCSVFCDLSQRRSLGEAFWTSLHVP
jgi:hypothetical protein